jgi:hypothetical protein
VAAGYSGEGPVIHSLPDGRFYESGWRGFAWPRYGAGLDRM